MLLETDTAQHQAGAEGRMPRVSSAAVRAPHRWEGALGLGISRHSCSSEGRAIHLYVFK